MAVQIQSIAGKPAFYTRFVQKNAYKEFRNTGLSKQWIERNLRDSSHTLPMLVYHNQGIYRVVQPHLYSIIFVPVFSHIHWKSIPRHKIISTVFLTGQIQPILIIQKMIAFVLHLELH